MAKHLFISDNLLASKQASKQASVCIKEKECGRTERPDTKAVHPDWGGKINEQTDILTN